jgi:hypothetical protein
MGELGSHVVAQRRFCLNMRSFREAIDPRTRTAFPATTCCRKRIRNSSVRASFPVEITALVIDSSRTVLTIPTCTMPWNPSVYASGIGSATIGAGAEAALPGRGGLRAKTLNDGILRVLESRVPGATWTPEAAAFPMKSCRGSGTTSQCLMMTYDIS